MINDKKFYPTLTNQKDIAYFDNASSTQTHEFVLKAMNEYYEEFRSNAGEHGDNPLSAKTSEHIDIARENVAELINAHKSEIIFTSGTTQGMNMIANWGKHFDYVIICESDHNANIAPWVAQGRTKDNGKLIILPVNDFNGQIELDTLEKTLRNTDGNVLISICATSNVTGVTQPWETIASIGHKYGASVAMDFCQTIPHHKIDLSANPVEWAVFSGHKMFGPTGVGVLCTQFDLQDLPSLYFGGGANNVTFNTINHADGPIKHMPGTPNIAGIIGLGKAAEMISYYGYDQIKKDEDLVKKWLLSYGIDVIPNANIYPTYNQNGNNIITLVPLKGHPQDVALLLSNNNVAVRCGRLCAHPMVDRLSSKGVVRISFAPYNTQKDCEKLVKALNSAFAKIK